MDTWSNFVGAAGGGSGVGGHMMQQVKLPQSTLSAKSSSFLLESNVSLTGWASNTYSMSLVWGDTVYVQAGSSFLTYNRATKTQGPTISFAAGCDTTTRFVQIIVGKRAFMLSGYNLYFCVLDLEGKTVTKLSSPPYGLGGYANGAQWVLPVMRYDSVYNKIYAAVPIRNGSSNSYSYELVVYDVASNTWTMLAQNPGSFNSGAPITDKGCLIDFSADKVKFVSNMNRLSGNPWSFTTTRNASPSGGDFQNSETVFTKLQGNNGTGDYSTCVTIVQTDDKVFGLQGTKLFTFNLFTGATSDLGLFGAIPLSTSGSYPAVRTYGCNYSGGKLWYCDGQKLYSMNYDQVAKAGGPLVWKILKGQKYSAPEPFALHRANGSMLNITAAQQEAAEDIPIYMGEYENIQAETYLLIEQ